MRRTLYVDVVNAVGNCSVSNFKKNDVVQGIIDRGAPVQAGSVIRELSSAYDFAISMDFLPEDFVNPALFALNTFKMRKVKLTCSKGKRVLDHSELIKVLHWTYVRVHRQSKGNSKINSMDRLSDGGTVWIKMGTDRF